MKQALHIFRKDTRRFWIEIFASLLVLGTYAVCYPIRWQTPILFGQPKNYLVMVQGVESLIVILIPAVWWLLVARVIQAESLVGDRQWWLTRPYEWKSLLAAKALFLLVWLYVPFVLAQMAILVKAGLGYAGHASHWFFLLSFFSAVVVFPLVAIAAVTSNFARMTLTLLGGFVMVIVSNAVASQRSPGYEPAVPYPHYFYIVVVLALCGAAIVALQYATRRTWLARTLLAGTLVLVASMGLGLAAMRQGQMDREFPTAADTTAAPVQITFQPSDSNRLMMYSSQRTGMVYVQLPLEFSGVAEGSAVELEDLKFGMDSTDGQHWTSPWASTQKLQFLPGTYHPGVQIMLSREQYERFKSQPMTLRLTLAITQLHAAGETTAAISEGDFRAEGLGVCAGGGQGYLNHALFCRTEGGHSLLTHITTTWSRYPCSGPQPGSQDSIEGMAWTGKAYADPLDSVWNPVVLSILQPEAHHSDGRLAGTHDLTLCSGTPVHFTQYAVTRRTQVSLTIPNFQLPVEHR